MHYACRNLVFVFLFVCPIPPATLSLNLPLSSRRRLALIKFLCPPRPPPPHPHPKTNTNSPKFPPPIASPSATSWTPSSKTSGGNTSPSSPATPLPCAVVRTKKAACETGSVSPRSCACGGKGVYLIGRSWIRLMCMWQGLRRPRRLGLVEEEEEEEEGGGMLEEGWGAVVVMVAATAVWERRGA